METTCPSASLSGTINMLPLDLALCSIISRASSIWDCGAGHWMLPSSFLIVAVSWYSGTAGFGLFFAGDLLSPGGNFRFEVLIRRPAWYFGSGTLDGLLWKRSVLRLELFQIRYMRPIDRE